MKIIQPNHNLAEEYYKNAEETLRITNLIKNANSNMWLATQKYYALYLAAYSILMKIGIKTEIHECTIAIIRFLEKEKLLDFNFSLLLEKDKQVRIENQYYLKNREVEYDSKEMSVILLNIRRLLDELNSDTIQEVRSILKDIN